MSTRVIARHLSVKAFRHAHGPPTSRLSTTAFLGAHSFSQYRAPGTYQRVHSTSPPARSQTRSANKTYQLENNTKNKQNSSTRHLSTATMFGTSNTFDPNTDVPDLAGRVFVVTGGSAGIGFGICAHLLQHGPERIYLLGKKDHHLAEAQEELKKYGDVERISPIQVELEDLKATDQVAKQLLADLPRLDALVLNAGLGVGKYNETPADGLDSHMQVNVWAQFHLAMTLLPVLRKTPDSRLCMQSSELHRLGTSDVQFRDLAEVNTDVGPTVLYDRSKLAQVLLVRALHRRKQRGELGLAPGEAPWLIATHPGSVSTDQPEQAVEAYGAPMKAAVAAIRPFMKDPVESGCRPMLFAATSDRVRQESIDGAYIVPDCKVTEPSSQALDEELQERLWSLTEKVLKDRLGDLPYFSGSA